MAITRRALLRASALSAGAVMLARPLGVLAQPLGADDDFGTSRISRLFPGQRVVHADMHNHTIFSDADPGATAEMAYRTMEEGGMDVAALTDHSSVSWAPGGVPSEFPCPPDGDPLGAGEGCRSVMGLSNEEWDTTRTLAQGFTIPGQYLGVRGFEWSSPTLGHMNVWFTEQYIDPLHTGGVSGASTAADFVHQGREADPTPISAALEQLLRTSAEVVDVAGMVGFQRWLSMPSGSLPIGGGNEGLAGFNHPGREADRFGNFAYEPAIRDTVVSLELLNRDEDYLFELTDIGRTSPLVECLDKGWRPGILGVSDEHNPIKRRPVEGLGLGRGGLWVGELSDVGVKEAMRQRRFYATRVKGLRLDAAADGVRMGQAFAHQGGRIRFQLDLATGTEHAGRTLSVHVIAAPAPGTGALLPAVLDQKVVTLPTGVVEMEVAVDPEVHPWVALRVSEPGPTSGAGLGFRPDGRAAGTEYEPLGATWAYSSPWYLDPAAAPAPASRRAPLTVPGSGPGAGSGSGSSGSGSGGAGSGSGGSVGGTPEPTPPTSPQEETVVTPVVHRRGGADRVGTAVELSRATFVAGVDTVLVAAAGTFPDALSGAAAAGTVPGPVLLVAAEAVPDVVVAELERLAPRRIVVLGGTGVVGQAVEARLATLAPIVQRVAGADRYATSAAISAAFFGDGVSEVWVASGASFADALPAGPAAGRAGGPLLLTAADALPAVVEDELRRLAPQRIVLLGGPAVVGGAVADRLGAIAPTTRVAGEDRYGTAAAVAQRVFPAARSLVVASGEAFADALAAGPVALVGGGPVLLVTRDAVPAATDAELRRLRPEVITIAGGPAAVSDAVRAQLESYDIR